MLPVSRTISVAISSARAAERGGRGAQHAGADVVGLAAQPGWAACAARTAASRSAAEATPTVPERLLRGLVEHGQRPAAVRGAELAVHEDPAVPGGALLQLLHWFSSSRRVRTDNVCHTLGRRVLRCQDWRRSRAWQTRGAMASLADISRRAGTSVATASRVLNGSTHPVSEATRARVLQAAADLGYAPSALAQALVTRSSRIIGVIVNDIVDPYFAEIARGVEDVAGRMGYLVMVCNADRRPEAELEYVRALRDYHAVGLVFAGSGAPERRGERGARRRRSARHASAARASSRWRSATSPRSTSASTTRRAAYDVTDYLISLGHRRIAFVEGPPGLYTSAERLAGFARRDGRRGPRRRPALPRRLRLRGGRRRGPAAARLPAAARRGRRGQRRGGDRRAHRAPPRRGRRARARSPSPGSTTRGRRASSS